MKLIFKWFIKTVNVIAVYVDHFDIFLFDLSCLFTEERSVKATVNDVKHGLDGKKLRK